MEKESTMKQECPYELSANAELCPLQIPTFLPTEASIDDLKDFFTGFVERDLWHLTNVSVGQIVMLLATKPKNTSFDEKCNAITDLFVQGLMEKRAEMLSANQ